PVPRRRRPRSARAGMGAEFGPRDLRPRRGAPAMPGEAARTIPLTLAAALRGRAALCGRGGAAPEQRRCRLSKSVARPPPAAAVCRARAPRGGAVARAGRTAPGRGPDMSGDRGPSSRPLEELILRYWDGALSPEELRELNFTLASEEEARALFRQFCVQALSIGECFEVAKVYPLPEAARGAERPASRKRAWIASAAVAALLVGAALVAAVRWRPAAAPVPPQEPVSIARV